MTACMHASSSSVLLVLSLCPPAPLRSPAAACFPLALFNDRTLDNTGTIPQPIHASLRWSWPISSFFSRRNTAVCAPADSGFWSSSSIGGAAARVIVRRGEPAPPTRCLAATPIREVRDWEMFSSLVVRGYQVALLEGRIGNGVAGDEADGLNTLPSEATRACCCTEGETIQTNCCSIGIQRRTTRSSCGMQSSKLSSALLSNSQSTSRSTRQFSQSVSQSGVTALGPAKVVLHRESELVLAPVAVMVTGMHVTVSQWHCSFSRNS